MTTRKVTASLGKPGGAAATGKAPNDAMEVARRAREQLHAEIAQSAEAQSAKTKAREGRDATAPPVFVREDLDEAVIAIGDVEYTLGPPTKGQSVTVITMAMYDGREYSIAEANNTKAALFVRAIGGQPVGMPATLMERDRLITQIGDVAFTGIAWCVRQYWPPTNLNELRLVKKKSRGG